MLGFGYRAEIFRGNFPENSCLFSGDSKRFKDVETAHTNIHIVEGENVKHLPEFYRDLFG